MTDLRKFFAALLIAFSAFVFAPAALAGDPEIDAAIEAGIVGERIDGFLGVVGKATPSLERKVQEINNKRRAVYEQKAQETGTTVPQVARIAGEKQIAKLDAGEFFMAESAAWEKK
jgi:uncharacterized protein